MENFNYLFNGDYFQLQPDYIIWKEDLLLPDWLNNYTLSLELQAAWIKEAPIESVPELTLLINTQAPILDNYQTGSNLNLYSAKLRRLIAPKRVQFETFPVKLVDQKTKQPLELDYQWFHLQETRSALEDTSFSIPLFRVRENGMFVIIHKEFKAELDEAGITGCEYTLLTPEHTLRKLLMRKLRAQH